MVLERTGEQLQDVVTSCPSYFNQSLSLWSGNVALTNNSMQISANEHLNQLPQLLKLQIGK